MTFSPSAFLYAVPTAMLTLVSPSLYHVLSVALFSSFVDLEAFKIFPSESAR